MDVPSVPRQLGYFNRLRVRPEHHEWMRRTLAETEPSRLGRMVALANALVFLFLGLLAMLLGAGTVGITILFCAPLVAAIGQVPAVVRFRARQLASTNDLDPPDWAI